MPEKMSWAEYRRTRRALLRAITGEIDARLGTLPPGKLPCSVGLPDEEGRTYLLSADSASKWTFEVYGERSFRVLGVAHHDRFTELGGLQSGAVMRRNFYICEVPNEHTLDMLDKLLQQAAD